jgi:hypothetical protein
MKKLVIMAVLAAAAFAASATEIGVRYSSGFTGSGDKQGESTGIVVNQPVGKGIGAELAFDRSVTGPAKVDRYSALATYDVAKVAGVTVTAKAGGAYVQPTGGTEGYALVAGVGVSYPVYKTVSLVADYSYQLGQDRVQRFDGNTVSVGVKVGF